MQGVNKPNFLEILGNEFDAELCEGYYDGSMTDIPEPGPNRHPVYIHGFWNGRDDNECARKVRRFPRKTAHETRETLEYLEAVFR